MDDLSVERIGNQLVISVDPVKGTATSKSTPIMLPTEIWIIILTMVIDPDCLCCDYCTSFDFLRLNREWNMLRASSLTDINDQAVRLRLVCRLWSLLLDPIWRPYLRAENLHGISSYKNIRALSIDQNYDWDCKEYKLYPSTPALFEATKNINSLLVYYPMRPKDFVDFLFKYSEYFPNLRSFFYITEGDLSHDFWGRLETAFPRLTALTLLGPGSDGGSISLPHLEILDIDVWTDDPPHFHFPSLKHLASDTESNSPCFARILQTHGKDIESLLLPCYDPGEEEIFGEDFWTRFPKLKLLGSTSSSLLPSPSKKLPRPPIGHVFNHLCIYDVELWSIQSIIAHLGRLRHFSLLCEDGAEDAAREVVLIDKVLVAYGAERLEIRLYGKKVHPEIERLWKQGSWQKATYHPSTDDTSFLFTWGFESKEDNPLS